MSTIRMPHMPDWLTWILHGLVHAAVGCLLYTAEFTMHQVAVLLTVSLIWWIDREESQDGYRKTDDYMDLLGPVLVTIVWWILACTC